uniref:non-specific serine/threonine protein kinase n=1 Tax=Setaria italica TaxID=4555 RepID=K3Y3D7_SETIT
MPALALLRLALLITVLVQQARLLPAAAARMNLTAGGTLKPPGYITSPSGSFAFGFRAHDSDPTKFHLATWFRFSGDDDSRPQRQSVVWFAKESTMGVTPNATVRSVLSIPVDGQLTLADGSRELWRAPTTSMQRGSVLVLRDSGNVQFLSDGGNDVLWESFGYPTDTLLRGQSLKGFLFSKRADAETTATSSSACIDLFTGDILENTYWATGTNTPNGNTTITFDDQGSLSYTLYNGAVNTLISPVFARMEPDGIVRTYVPPKNGGENTSWTVPGTFPRCKACVARPGSYCVEAKERLRCLCPSGYTYIDAQHSDSGGTPAFEPQSCDGISIYKKFPAVTEQQCRDYCLSDCFCAAALMIGGSDCAKVGALAYGRQGRDVTTTALVKVRKGNTSHTERASSRMMRKIPRPYMIVVSCLASLLMITVGSLVALYNLTRNKVSQQALSSSVRAFTWKELYMATDGFKELLLHLIAVKRLVASNEYSEQEFTNEVQSIGQIHHRNLVRMIDYCKEDKHRMLVFEFMPGGSLRSFLFNPDVRPPWRWRAEAALAIPRGLEYLHDGCSAPVIHCDIKPDNILLDDLGVPKINSCCLALFLVLFLLV